MAYELLHFSLEFVVRFVYLEQDKHIEVVGTADLESGYVLLQVGPESVMFSFIFGNTYHRTAAYLYYLALKLGSLR